MYAKSIKVWFLSKLNLLYSSFQSLESSFNNLSNIPLVIDFCLISRMKQSAEESTFGIPSPLSPLIIFSFSSNVGLSDFRNFFWLGAYCFTFAYFCNCRKSPSPDRISIFSDDEYLGTKVPIISSASAISTSITLYGKLSLSSCLNFANTSKINFQSNSDLSRFFFLLAL